MEEVLKEIKDFSLAHNFVSVYLVGLQDDSVFSDIDLVVVLENDQDMLFVNDLKCINNLIDLRKVVSRQEFLEQNRFWPYHKMELLCGQDLREFIEKDPNEDIVKMSMMFFVSFLRNYYVHFSRKAINVPQLLKDLNDFNYCSYFLKYTPERIKVFLLEINNARLSSDVNQEKARLLLEQAIDLSWYLIEILNEELQKRFILTKKNSIFLLVNPTIIIKLSVFHCRKYTELFSSFFSRLRLLFLPSGFNFVFSRDQYVDGFIRVNFKNNHLGSSVLKVVFKNVLAYVAYFYFSLVVFLKRKND